jgi:hypothetical protein
MIKHTLVRLAFICGLALVAGAVVNGSGLVGVVAIVERVVFEPNEANADRIQVWGAFAHADGGPERSGQFSTPKKGYMYFRIPETASAAQRQTIRNEWADLKAVAGKGQVVGFGRWFYIGPFTSMGQIFPAEGGSFPVDLQARAATATPSAPINYVTNIGLVKFEEQGTHAATVKQLKDALAGR